MAARIARDRGGSDVFAAAAEGGDSDDDEDIFSGADSADSLDTPAVRQLNDGERLFTGPEGPDEAIGPKYTIPSTLLRKPQRGPPARIVDTDDADIDLFSDDEGKSRKRRRRRRAKALPGGPPGRSLDSLEAAAAARTPAPKPVNFL